MICVATWLFNGEAEKAVKYYVCTCKKNIRRVSKAFSPNR